MAIDHVTLKVKDLTRAKAFYAAALAPLGYRQMMEFEHAVGFGTDRPDFWLGKYDVTAPPAHIAFTARDKAAVDAFHRAALAAGGQDHGAPGRREHYHPGFYGAFILDPEGNNIEAVIHNFQG